MSASVARRPAVRAGSARPAAAPRPAASAVSGRRLAGPARSPRHAAAAAARSSALRVDLLAARRAPPCRTRRRSAGRAIGETAGRAGRGRRCGSAGGLGSDAAAVRLVVLLGRLGLAAHAGCDRSSAVHGGGQRGVRGPPPVQVERRGRTARTLSVGGGVRRSAASRPGRARSTCSSATSGPEARPSNGSPGQLGQLAAGRAPVPLAAGRGTAAGPRPGCCRRGPPGDDLALGPGQRDVEQPQVLPGLLGPVAGEAARTGPGRTGRRRRARSRRVRGAGSCSRRIPPSSGRRRAVPGLGQVDDRELQALAAVHGQDR